MRVSGSNLDQKASPHGRLEGMDMLAMLLDYIVTAEFSRRNPDRADEAWAAFRGRNGFGTDDEVETAIRMAIIEFGLGNENPTP